MGIDSLYYQPYRIIYVKVFTKILQFLNPYSYISLKHHKCLLHFKLLLDINIYLTQNIRLASNLNLNLTQKDNFNGILILIDNY